VGASVTLVLELIGIGGNKILITRIQNYDGRIWSGGFQHVTTPYEPDARAHIFSFR
jgi:hypothetical protein